MKNNGLNIQDVNSDTVKYLPFKFFPGLAGLATIFFLTRSFSPEQYGLYSYLISSTLIFIQLGNSWIVNSVLYVFPEYEEDEHWQLERIVSLLQFVILAGLAIVLFFLVFTFTKSFYLSVLSACLLFLQSYTGLYNGFLQSKRAIKVQLIASVFQSVTQIILLYLVIYKYKNDVSVAILMLIISFLIGFLILWNGKRNKVVLKYKLISAKQVISKILKFGIPMGIWFFFYQLIISGDRIIMKYYNLGTELGQYSSFKDLMVGVSGFLTMPILLASHPIIMKMWKTGGDVSEIESVIKKNVSVILLLFVPIIILFAFVGKDLMEITLGRNYLLSNFSMVMILVSVLLASLNLYIQKGLEVTGKTIKMAVIALCSSIIGLLLNILLVPIFKLSSVIIISIGVQVLYAIIIYFYTRNILKFSFSYSSIGRLLLWCLFVVCYFYGLTNFTNFSNNALLLTFVPGFLMSLFVLYYNSDELKPFVNLISSFIFSRTKND